MTDDDCGLSQTEAARWDAIVASEWPIEAAILTEQLNSGAPPSGVTERTAEQRFVTVYQPRRPRITPLAVGISALAATAWLTIQILIPAYQGSGQAGIFRAERAVEVHDLTIAAALVTITLVVAVSCIGIWTVATARYRLRRSSCRLVARQSTQVTLWIRPPNPATAAMWMFLLFSATAVAGWWVPLQLGRVAESRLDAIQALHLASVGAIGWLATALMCALGLTAWAARETRHRLRSTALRGFVN